MPIYAPGKRYKGRAAGFKSGRKLVAQLSLTAMVDMFTVLVVFLLMNYKTTETVLYIPKEVTLPEASEIKELQPAHVVTVTDAEVYLDKELVATYEEVKQQTSWMIERLRYRIQEMFREDDVEFNERLNTVLRSAVGQIDEEEKLREKDNRRKITIQADKETDFLTIKKVMYTVSEAGAKEISFAVNSIPPDKGITEILRHFDLKDLPN